MQMLFFDIPTVSLPIAILTMTIIQIQINEPKINYVITAFSGMSTILSLLNRVMGLQNKITTCIHIKQEYDRLNMEIEWMGASNYDITDDQIKNIESKLESIIRRDEGIVPESVIERFLGNSSNIIRKYYSTPERDIIRDDVHDVREVQLDCQEDTNV
jgi:hypothetical protein